MIQALLWDLDGVLVDTTDLHYWAWADALHRHGRDISRADFMATFGMNNRGIIGKLFGVLPEVEIQSISDMKEAIFRDAIPGKVFLYPGVVDWLDYARKHGIYNAIASSAPRENIDTLLDHFSLRGYFDTLASAADLPGKPDPAVFLLAARKLHTESQHCLVLEDAPAGALAAARAGMHCVAVLTTRARQAFPPVDMFLERLSDISPAEAILKINQAA